jgi:protease IV
MAKKRKVTRRATREKSDWFSNLSRVGGVIKGLFSFAITLFFVMLIFGLVQGPEVNGLGEGNVAVVPVRGVIVTSGSGGFGESVVTADALVERIQKLDEDEDIDAIIFEINSPGGSPVASDEIGFAIKNMKKPNIAVIREVGASGGYWIASATEYIYANRMSITGSIGVIGSGFGVEGLMNDYNITYRRQAAGKYKDAGTPFRAPTDEENALLQHVLDSIHDEFIIEVAQNRNMSVDKVREIATGFIYLGTDAQNLGLIDEIGNLEDARLRLESQLDKNVTLAKYKEDPSLMGVLFGATKDGFYSVGRGIGDSFKVQDGPKFELR